jgi:hypothetical protein
MSLLKTTEAKAIKRLYEQGMPRYKIKSSGGVFSLRSISLTARTKHVVLIMTRAIHRGYALPAARPRR